MAAEVVTAVEEHAGKVTPLTVFSPPPPFPYCLLPPPPRADWSSAFFFLLWCFLPSSRPGAVPSVNNWLPDSCTSNTGDGPTTHINHKQGVMVILAVLCSFFPLPTIEEEGEE